MVRKALFWSFSGQFTTMAVTFGSSIIISRLLSPREMGIYAVATATIGVLQLIAAFGVGSYVVREIDLTPQKLDAAFTVNAVLCALLALLVFGMGTFGSYLLSEPAVGRVLRLLAVTPLIGALSFRASVMLQRGMMFRGASIVGVTGAIISASVTIAAALAGASYMSPGYGGVVSSVISTIAMVLLGREHFSMRMSLFEWRKITAFGLRIMSINGLSSAAVRISDIVLAHFLGLAALGLYSRATNLNNLIFSNIYGTATGVIFVQLSAAQRDGDRVSAIFFRGFRIITALMGPILIGLAVLSRPAVQLLYGDKWIGAADPLSLLLIGQFVALGFAMNWELFVIRDDLKTQTKLEITRSLLSVTTTIIASLFSLIAVAATSVVDSIISLILYGRHMPRLAKVSWSQLTSVYGEACLLTLAAVVPSFMLMTATRFDSHTSLPLIAGMVLVGILFWLGVLWRIDHPLMEEIGMLLSRVQKGALARFGQAGSAK